MGVLAVVDCVGEGFGGYGAVAHGPGVREGGVEEGDVGEAGSEEGAGYGEGDYAADGRRVSGSAVVRQGSWR